MITAFSAAATVALELDSVESIRAAQSSKYDHMPKLILVNRCKQWYSMTTKTARTRCQTSWWFACYATAKIMNSPRPVLKPPQETDLPSMNDNSATMSTSASSINSTGAGLPTASWMNAQNKSKPYAHMQVARKEPTARQNPKVTKIENTHTHLRRYDI